MIWVDLHSCIGVYSMRQVRLARGVRRRLIFLCYRGDDGATQDSAIAQWIRLENDTKGAPYFGLEDASPDAIQKPFGFGESCWHLVAVQHHDVLEI
jgi:hypothetical protein